MQVYYTRLAFENRSEVFFELQVFFDLIAKVKLRLDWFLRKEYSDNPRIVVVDYISVTVLRKFNVRNVNVNFSIRLKPLNFWYWLVDCLDVLTVKI